MSGAFINQSIISGSQTTINNAGTLNNGLSVSGAAGTVFNAGTINGPPGPLTSAPGPPVPGICPLLVIVTGPALLIPLNPPADEPLEPPLALDQRQVAQIIAVALDQVEGVQHRLMGPALASQRVKIRCPVFTGNNRFAVDKKRLRLEPGGSINDGREAVGPVVPLVRVKQRMREPSRRTIRW